MCIIAAKPAGTEMPSEKYINNMFDNNKDGAGLMYALDGRVHIEKGFMTKTSFFRRLDELDEEYGLTSLPVVMHFRITTHGGTKPENCHPFPITDSIGMLQKLRCTTDIGVAHNGIIDIRVRNKNISDTMEYIARQLAPLKRAVPSFYKNKDLMQMVYSAIDSKMVLMNSMGELFFIGDFREEKGIKYSNGTYSYNFNFRDYPHGSIGLCDYYSDYMYDYEEREIMWLNESKGEYVIDYAGDLCGGEGFAIDKEEKLYYFDVDFDGLIEIDGYARTAEGHPLRYNPESKFTQLEYVIKETAYE